MNLRSLFLRYNAQTSEAPIALPIIRAEGVHLFDDEGKAYIDLIGGISVCNLGHSHPAIRAAIHEQVDRYMHVMVYGELVQSPQVLYAQALCEQLPASLQSVFFTNSGTEATEGAMKLAKRVTGRYRFVSFKNSYHGSTQGALSVMGDPYWQDAFRPLLPGIDQFDYGSFDALEAITPETAAVILEPVQSESGVTVPDTAWLQAIRARCTETGTLLIFDEIQSGFGRTGSLFRFQAINIIPDVLLLGKALGGGMPLGAFIASPEHMHTLTHTPVLGHISTFGGHPVSCAAGHAALKELLRTNLIHDVATKSNLLAELLRHPRIKKIQRCGLLMALHVDSYEQNKRLIDRALQYGVFTDWFLFASNALRIAPPLTISIDEIHEACNILQRCFNEEV